ncbi:MAG: endonuclease [Bacilli bacterium]|nr:endonuclease [Bacilli bacterium]
MKKKIALLLLLGATILTGCNPEKNPDNGKNIIDNSSRKEADNIINKINSIGTVDNEIDAARKAYDKLSDDAKKLVTNYDILVNAENAFVQNSSSEDINAKQEAEAIISLINKIGTVTLDSKSLIEEARTAYDKASTEVKALVTNYNTLLSAEAAYQALVENKNDDDTQGGDTSFDYDSSTDAYQNGTYYADILDTDKGETLFNKLNKTLNDNYKALGYGDLWTAYKDTDLRDDGTIWDMYGDFHFKYGTDQAGNYSNEGDKYNREHSIPKSWFSEKSPAASDLFHIYPTDGKINNERSNYPFGEVSNASYVYPESASNELGQVKLGESSFPGYTGIVFEPYDEYKGDFARTYFYFATHFPGWATNGYGSSTFTKSFPYMTTYGINLMLKWCRQDPVSQKEIKRNEAAYKLVKARNPFIDHVSYVYRIWDPNNAVATKSAVSIKAAVQDDANKVINLIDELKDAIDILQVNTKEARQAYDQASSEVKSLVTNYNDLLKAEIALEKYELPSDSEDIDIKDQNKAVITFIDGNYGNEAGFDFEGSTSTSGSNYEPDRGLQWNKQEEIIVKTSSYEGAIKGIKLDVSQNSTESEYNIRITVGGQQIGDIETISGRTAHEEVFFKSRIELSGEIIILITTPKISKSFYLKSITIY